MTRRPLQPGDRIFGIPCDVTISQTDRGVTGWCSTCHAVHIIDGPLYADGRGPWRLRNG